MLTCNFNLMFIWLLADYTHGNHCELCIPGSFGNATTAEGCKPCQCNGHGDPSKNLCDISTGKCFCTDFTMGDHCDKCEPGLVGDPKYVEKVLVIAINILHIEKVSHI